MPRRALVVFVVCLLGTLACYSGPAPLDGQSRGSTGVEAGAGTLEMSGSQSGTATGVECTPTEQGVRDAILIPACATEGCHDAVAVAAGLDLSVPDLTAALVGVEAATCEGQTLVVPGDPGRSFLFDKLQAQPMCGTRMPVVASLSDDEIACIEAWIEEAESTCETCGEPTCVELQTSPSHCGACENACPDGVACVEGACVCPGATVLCDGVCVDTESDPTHCGACGQACDDGLFCAAGSCTDDCGDLSECSGACVDVDSNALHCGGCDSPCGDGEACQSGQCGCDAPPTSYAADVEPFIVADCATNGCHRPMGMNPGSEGLDLSTGAGYDALVGVAAVQCGERMLVEPGSPGTSYLYDKVRGINLCQGSIMPKMGPGLTTEQLQTMADWICSGAAP